MKPVIIFISLLFSINLNAQKNKLFLSTWKENRTDDVSIPSDAYSNYKKGRLYYFLSNDNMNIYIDMNIEDAQVQNRILKEGLTVWISMDNKSSRKLGVRFPVGSQNAGGRIKPNMPDVKINADEGLATPLSLAGTIELIGFTNEEARRFPADNYDNFRGAVNIDKDGTLHYKMLMPIAKLPVRNSKGGDGAMPFTLGIEYGSTTGQSSGAAVILWIKNIKLATDK
jgi:hypothetical protein